MKQSIIIQVISLLTLFSCCAQEKSTYGKRLSGLDSEIERLLEEHHTAGLAVAVVKDGKTIYSRGFGYRDYEKKLPVDENTVFGIGSCTKAFTAALLGQLQDEGKLKLSDKPSEYLPELQFYNQEMNDSIQLKNLLTHSTGLNSWPSESTSILFITPDKYELIPRIKYIKPTAGVGKRWDYNNLMYTVAGMVVEEASGQRLEDNWKQKIFEPLGMTNSYVDWRPAYKTDNFSYGYAVDGITPVRVIPEDMSTRGAGGAIYSTVNDMAKWMNLWLREGRVGDSQLLSKKYIKAAQSPLSQLPNNPNDSINPTPVYYGYGWFNLNEKGQNRVTHSGGTSGYVSNLLLLPDENLGIVILTNQTRTSIASKITNRIIERFYPKIEEDDLEVVFGQAFTIAENNIPTISDTIQAPEYALKDVIGGYHHPGFGSITFSLEGETLYAQFPLTKFRLEYVGNNTFIDHYTEDIPHTYWSFMRFNFEKDENGSIKKVLINLDQEPVQFIKTE